MWYVREYKRILYPPPISAPIIKKNIEIFHQDIIDKIPKTSLIRVDAGGPPIIPTHLINQNNEKNEDQSNEFWLMITLRVNERRYII